MALIAATMAQHTSAPATETRKRVVLSRLPQGASAIGSKASSIKILVEGEEHYLIDGKVHRLTPGCMLFVSPGEPLEATVRTASRSRGLCVYFDVESVSLEDSVAEPRASLRALNASASGRALLSAVVAAHLHGDSWATLAPAIMERAMAAFHGSTADAIDHWNRLPLKRPGARREVLNRLEQARAYLHQVTDRSVPLQEIAAFAGMSSFHMARYFQAVYGRAPVGYHRALRMVEAARMLRDGKCTVTQAAEAVGYADLSAFSHAFSRERGSPPSRALSKITHHLKSGPA